MTEAELKAIVPIRAHVAETVELQLAAIIADAVLVAVASVKAEMAELKRQVAEINTRGPGVEYRGIFTQGTTYAKGSLCTKAGGLWLALDDTGLPPGTNTSCWRLVVKSDGA